MKLASLVLRVVRALLGPLYRPDEIARMVLAMLGDCFQMYVGSPLLECQSPFFRGVCHAAFSPHCTLTSDINGRVSVWSASGQRTAVPARQPGNVLEISRDGRYFLAGYYKAVDVWRTHDMHPFTLDIMNRAKFSYDSRSVIFCSGIDFSIQVLDLETRAQTYIAGDGMNATTALSVCEKGFAFALFKTLYIHRNKSLLKVAVSVSYYYISYNAEGTILCASDPAMGLIDILRGDTGVLLRKIPGGVALNYIGCNVWITHSLSEIVIFDIYGNSYNINSRSFILYYLGCDMDGTIMFANPNSLFWIKPNANSVLRSESPPRLAQ